MKLDLPKLAVYVIIETLEKEIANLEGGDRQLCLEEIHRLLVSQCQDEIEDSEEDLDADELKVQWNIP